METQSPVAPGSPSASFKEAAEAWRRQDYQKTIEMLTAASRQQPSNAKLLLNLAEAHGRRFDYQAAECCLEKAVTVAWNKADTLAEAGRRCQRFAQPAMANSYFARAAELPNVDPSVLVALAEFEEGYSRTEAALSFLRRALDLEPEYPSALLARARLHRVSGELEKAERVLRSILGKMSGETASKGWYEMGTILDRQGLYDQAMQAFLQAKACIALPREFAADLEQMRAEIRNVEKAISAGTLGGGLMGPLSYSLLADSRSCVVTRAPGRLCWSKCSTPTRELLPRMRPLFCWRRRTPP